MLRARVPPVCVLNTRAQFCHSFNSSIDTTMTMVDDHNKRKRMTGIPKFLRSLYRMLESEDPSVIGWSHDGTAIQILSERRLESEILRKYFNHEKASSFQRQLNNFGFRKWTKTQSHVCTFSHPCFLRQHPELLVQVLRKSPRSMGKLDDQHHAADLPSPTTVCCETTTANPNQENQQTHCNPGGPLPSTGFFTFDEPKIESIQHCTILPPKSSYAPSSSTADLWDVFQLDDAAWDFTPQYPFSASQPAMLMVHVPQDDKTWDPAQDYDMSFFLDGGDYATAS
ncbi:Aste57867_25014 [Aphanomyces stellatus]|uniref:Aste57867_25014 protein n=1 Tax=Aphanomyces stellatus TaxID=120398 RepID=A0A485LRZ8_9STRA|nr:hypothetical protein As57867_024936 [Aphanomyces stellatus]VFU01645.1 Aste57867_25014 [Aphanomyces stellatus]